MRTFFTRHLPHQPISRSLLAGLGGFIAIAAIGAFTSYAHMLLIMAPFGASCVLLFAAPASPLSQPAHVIGGHVVATLVGLLLRMMLPNEWWAAALAVGLAIALMAALRVTHPPAGADPLVVFATDPGFGFLLFPVLSGAIVLAAVATLFHKSSGTAYPARKS
jgi:CBS-domain-containing membrane protein